MYDLIDNESVLEGMDDDEDRSQSKFETRLPKGYLSVSQVNLYTRCGEQYYRRYVLNQPTAPSYAQVQGRGVHKAAEKLHLKIIETGHGYADPAEMVQEYSDLFDKEVKDVEVSLAQLIDPDQDPGVLKDVGVSMTKTYFQGAMGAMLNPDNGLLYPLIQPIAAERVVRSEVTTPDGDKIPFMGVIDIEEQHSLSDLKTRGKLASQLEVDNNLQLTMYAYMTGKPVVRMDQVIKPSKKLPTRYIRTEAVRSQSEIEHVTSVVAEVADDIVRGRFRKTSPENWWCSVKMCPYWHDCRGKVR